MEKPDIEGVKVIQLRKIPDERGAIFHMLRRTDKHFTQFGEIYFSRIYRGAIKGWHAHNKITLNYCVVLGMVKLVLIDTRKSSSTSGAKMELFVGDDNYVLVQIPPGVVNGHKGISEFSILANCTDLSHDELESDEMLRIDPIDNDFDYNWDIKQC